MTIFRWAFTISNFLLLFYMNNFNLLEYFWWKIEIKDIISLLYIINKMKIYISKDSKKERKYFERNINFIDHNIVKTRTHFHSKWLIMYFLPLFPMEMKKCTKQINHKILGLSWISVWYIASRDKWFVIYKLHFF